MIFLLYLIQRTLRQCIPWSLGIIPNYLINRGSLFYRFTHFRQFDFDFGATFTALALLNPARMKDVRREGCVLIARPPGSLHLLTFGPLRTTTHTPPNGNEHTLGAAFVRKMTFKRQQQQPQKKNNDNNNNRKDRCLHFTLKKKTAKKTELKE